MKFYIFLIISMLHTALLAQNNKVSISILLENENPSALIFSTIEKDTIIKGFTFQKNAIITWYIKDNIKKETYNFIHNSDEHYKILDSKFSTIYDFNKKLKQQEGIAQSIRQSIVFESNSEYMNNHQGKYKFTQNYIEFDYESNIKTEKKAQQTIMVIGNYYINNIRAQIFNTKTYSMKKDYSIGDEIEFLNKDFSSYAYKIKNIQNNTITLSKIEYNYDFYEVLNDITIQKTNNALIYERDTLNFGNFSTNLKLNNPYSLELVLVDDSEIPVVSQFKIYKSTYPMNNSFDYSASCIKTFSLDFPMFENRIYNINYIKNKGIEKGTSIFASSILLASNYIDIQQSSKDILSILLNYNDVYNIKISINEKEYLKQDYLEGKYDFLITDLNLISGEKYKVKISINSKIFGRLLDKEIIAK